MDDGVPQPKPRASARVTKGVPPRAGTPTDPRTESPNGRRATPRSSGRSEAPSRPVVIAPSDLTGDPLLAPLPDGTPIEIPKIVPARLADPKPRSMLDVDTLGGGPPTMLVPSMPDVVVDDDAETDADTAAGGLLSRRDWRPARGVRAPVSLQRPRRPRVRRVTRVVRQVDTWSIFKVSLVFSLFMYIVSLTAGVLLWQVAQNTGTVDNIERFFESFGWKSFVLKGGAIYHNAWVGGLFLVVGMTGLCVLAATMFNLITDLVGGIRVTVLEEEVIAREDRGLGWRRASRTTTATTTATTPAQPSAPPAEPV